MRAIDLNLGTKLYKVNVGNIEVSAVITLKTDAGNIKADITDYKRTVIFEKESTVGKCSQWDYRYFINLDEAQDHQKGLRLKHLSDLNEKAAKAQKEYSDAVNEYLFKPVSNPHEQD